LTKSHIPSCETRILPREVRFQKRYIRITPVGRGP
jgi:hypothetical protein